MDEFLEYLYQDAMVEKEVFDDIYRAVKNATDSPYRTTILEWYADNIYGDEAACRADAR
jgi:hypothetical protein